LLGDSTQIIPNERFSVLGALVSSAIRAIREQQKEGTAKKKHRALTAGFVSVRASTF